MVVISVIFYHHQIKGPIVLQLQRVRNVAVLSAKQHSEASSKRLLRVQLTDGHTHCSGVEVEDRIPGLRLSLLFTFSY